LRVIVFCATLIYMALLKLRTESRARGGRTVRVDIDADQLERLAANFGFFNPEFLGSIEKAEDDYYAGRARTISSLKELR